MAGKLFHRKTNPVELVGKAHQAFVRLPYESSQDRIMEEISKYVSGIKVGRQGSREENQLVQFELLKIALNYKGF